MLHDAGRKNSQEEREEAERILSLGSQESDPVTPVLGVIWGDVVLAINQYGIHTSKWY